MGLFNPLFAKGVEFCKHEGRSREQRGVWAISLFSHENMSYFVIVLLFLNTLVSVPGTKVRTTYAWYLHK